MGDHYVPQYYLKGFTETDNVQIWVYDKKANKKFRTGINNIAHETKYYSPEVEKYLSEEIEGPANDVINKIRKKERIIEDDKVKLSMYITVLLKRVPQGKIRMKELAPEVAQKISLRYDKAVKELIDSNPSKTEFFKKRREEIQLNLDKYSKDLPKDFWLKLIPPDYTPNVAEALSKMTWRFFTCDEKPIFLTSDNPVFYFESIGLGKDHSELTFPLSSNITLWASWRTDLKEGYFQTKSQVVKEINRRTASMSTRFIYHAADEAWIFPFIKKDSYQLNKLV